MKISIDTKIASIVKENPLALEAIISISKVFEKLRNPYLYKLMAKRASINMACKIAGCKPTDFFQKLKPLGFDSVELETQQTKSEINTSFPDISNFKILHLDVRPIIEESQDPLQLILEKINILKDDEVLEVCNSFLPLPLIILLEKKGFLHKVEKQENNFVLVRFIRNNTNYTFTSNEADYNSQDWEQTYEKFRDKFSVIDVREMQMPEPMMTILEALENLEHGKALFIKHRRVPLFLIPELVERNIEYKVQRVSETEVNLILFHK